MRFYELVRVARGKENTCADGTEGHGITPWARGILEPYGDRCHVNSSVPIGSGPLRGSDERFVILSAVEMVGRCPEWKVTVTPQVVGRVGEPSRPSKSRV